MQAPIHQSDGNPTVIRRDEASQTSEKLPFPEEAMNGSSEVSAFVHDRPGPSPKNDTFQFDTLSARLNIEKRIQFGAEKFLEVGRS